MLDVPPNVYAARVLGTATEHRGEQADHLGFPLHRAHNNRTDLLPMHVRE